MNKETFDFVYECVKEIIDENTAIPYAERRRRLQIIENIKHTADFYDFLMHLFYSTPKEFETYIKSLSRETIEKFIEDTYISDSTQRQKLEKVKKLLKMIEAKKPAKTINQYISNK